MRRRSRDVRGIHRYLMFAAQVLLLAANESKAQIVEGSIDPVSLLYDVDIELMYLDQAQLSFSRSRVGLSPARGPEMIAPVYQKNVSTFGLRKARFGLTWSVPRSFELAVSLRPDALASDPQQRVREIDTRSGRFLEDATSIQLLDEYQLLVRRPYAKVYLGVERAAFDSYSMIPDVLDFGLHVRGPEKCFGAGLIFSPTNALFEESPNQGLEFRLNVLSGHDERHNGRKDDSPAQGESPAKRDPYWGAAGSIDWRLPKDGKLALSAAALESRIDGIKVRRDWWQLGLRRILSTPEIVKLAIGMEARQLRQSGNLEGTRISDESITSVGLTGDVYLSSAESVLVGLWYGTAELHPSGVQSFSKPSKSMQGNLGFKLLTSRQLEIVSMLSREWRKESVENEGVVGGFERDGGRQTTQSRFVLQLRYHIGSQL